MALSSAGCAPPSIIFLPGLGCTDAVFDAYFVHFASRAPAFVPLDAEDSMAAMVRRVIMEMQAIQAEQADDAANKSTSWQPSLTPHEGGLLHTDPVDGGNDLEPSGSLLVGFSMGGIVAHLTAATLALARSPLVADPRYADWLSLALPPCTVIGEDEASSRDGASGRAPLPRLAGLVLLGTSPQAESPDAYRGRLAFLQHIAEGADFVDSMADLVAPTYLPDAPSDEGLEDPDEGLEDPDEGLEDSAGGPASAPSLRDVAPLVREMADELGWHAYRRQAWALMRRPDLSMAFARVACPVLVVGASDDQLVSTAKLDALAGAFPHSTIHVLRDGGHFFPVLQAPTTMAYITDWMETCGL